MNEERFRIYIAAFLILKKGDEVLVARRKGEWNDGKLSLISGHLDGNETTRQCMIREAQEEAGIILSAQDLQIDFTCHCRFPDREYIFIYLSANQWHGTIENKEPEKCSELLWAQLDKLPEDVLPDVRFALNSIAQGKHYGEFGWN